MYLKYDFTLFFYFIRLFWLNSVGLCMHGMSPRKIPLSACLCHVAKNLHCILVPLQCTGSSGCFLRGKRTAIARRYLAFCCCWFCSCVQRFCVSIPPAVRPTLLRQMDMGSLTCTQIWVRAVHTKGHQAKQLI